MRRSTRTWALVSALIGLSLQPAPAAAQPEGEDVLLRGTVVDGEGFPVELAIVGLDRSDEAVLTNAEGQFAFAARPRTEYRIAAEQLGYHSGAVVLSPDEADRQVMIQLTKNPVLLEGLEVTVDRFERRRRFHAGSTRVLDQSALARSAAFNARDLILRTVGTTGVRRDCVPDLFGDCQPAGGLAYSPGCYGGLFGECLFRRGQLVRMTSCIDERPVFGAELEHYSPEELYLVEIFDRGESVRIYTRQFMERMAQRPKRLVPLAFGC